MFREPIQQNSLHVQCGEMRLVINIAKLECKVLCSPFDNIAYTLTWSHGDEVKLCLGNPFTNIAYTMMWGMRLVINIGKLECKVLSSPFNNAAHTMTWALWG